MADPIRLGVSLPMSGRDARAAWGSHYNAYRLWLDALNANGGLLGRPVELVVRDDGSLPVRSVEAYEELAMDKSLDLLFAPARSRTIEQVAPVTEREKRLLFVGHGSAHGMFAQGRKYLFLGWPGTDFDVPRSLFDWIATLPADQRPKRLALLRPFDPRPTYTEDPVHGINQHNTGVELGTRHYAASAGLELVLEEEYRDSGFDALFERVHAAKPDVVVVANYALAQDDLTMSFMKAYRGAGFGDTLLWVYRIPTRTVGGGMAGNRAADPRAVRERADSVFDDAFSYAHWDPRSPLPAARAFVDAFLERNDYLPDDISAGVYVACQLLQQSVAGAGTTDNEAVRAYLLNNSFETVMGTYKFQENGVPQARMLLLQAIDGEMQVVHPAQERTA